jgi:hypothetical protein
MTNEEYRKTEGISRSQLSVLLNQTPLHFHYLETQGGKEDNVSFAFGRASHKYILEKDDFFNEFAVAPNCDRRTKVGKQIWQDVVDKNPGKEVITQEDFEKIQAMSDQIDQTPLARQLLTGQVEQSFWWTDEETGEKCKVRPDCITEYDGRKYLVDYKTTDSCQDGHFERSVRKYGYSFQVGMYREGYFNNTYEDVGFIFVAQEKKPPYAARVYFCTDEFMDEGSELFRKTINLYHYCKSNNAWYGYEGALNSVSYLQGDGDI